MAPPMTQDCDAIYWSDSEDQQIKLNADPSAKSPTADDHQTETRSKDSKDEVNEMFEYLGGPNDGRQSGVRRRGKSAVKNNKKKKPRLSKSKTPPDRRNNILLKTPINTTTSSDITVPSSNVPAGFARNSSSLSSSLPPPASPGHMDEFAAMLSSIDRDIDLSSTPKDPVLLNDTSIEKMRGSLSGSGEHNGEQNDDERLSCSDLVSPTRPYPSQPQFQPLPPTAIPPASFKTPIKAASSVNQKLRSPDPFGDMFDDSAIKAMESAAIKALVEKKKEEAARRRALKSKALPPPKADPVQPAQQSKPPPAQPVQHSEPPPPKALRPPQTPDPFGDSLSQFDWGEIDKVVEAKQSKTSQQSSAPPCPPPDIEDCLVGKGTPFKSPRTLSQQQRDDQPMVKKRLQMTIADRARPPPRNQPVHNPQFKRCTSATTPTPTPNTINNPLSMTKELPNAPKYMGFSRYQILDVIDDIETLTKILTVTPFKKEFLETPAAAACSSTSAPASDATPTGYVYLRGDWFWPLVKKNDIFNIVSPSNRFLTTFKALPITFDTDPAPMSTDDDLLFILHPDHIVSPSYVCEQLSCQRKAALKHRMKGSSYQASAAGIIGTCAHELFEKTVGSNAVTIENFNDYADQIVKANSLALIACDITEKEAKSKLMGIVPHVQQFTKQFTAIDNGSDGQDEANGGVIPVYASDETVHFRATRVNATEEELLVPHLGLSGNVDVTFEAEMKMKGSNNTEKLIKSLVSMELKTGKKRDMNEQHCEVRPDHSAQLSLYTLMLKASHGANSGNDHGAGDGGVLLYLNETGHRPTFVPANVKITKTLIAQRNQLASNIIELNRNRGVSGPDPASGKVVVDDDFEPAKLPPIDEDRSLFSCKTCYANSACMLYKAAEIKRKQVEDPEGEERPWLAELLRSTTKHLSPEHLKYFEDWDRMLDMELNEAQKVSCFIEAANERERKTRKTISGLTWLRQAYIAADDVEGQDCELKFERDAVALSQAIEGEGDSPSQLSTGSNAKNIDRLLFEKGVRIIISSDATIFDCGERSTSIGGRHELHIVLGEVVSTGKDFVSIRCSKAYAEKLRRFADRWQKVDADQNLTVKFRIDLNEFGNNVGTLRENLMKLFRLNTMKRGFGLTVDESKREDLNIRQEDNSLKWLRSMVVDLETPKFERVPNDLLFAQGGGKLVGCDLEDLCFDFHSVLNQDQQRAVERVIGMKDYMVIQGLPGTGKTSTICFLIRLMVARGLKVLVSSYTHTAVDNLLTKLMESGVGVGEDGAGDIVRLGLRSKAAPDIEGIRPEVLAQRKFNGTSGEKLMQVVNEAAVVGCTCLSMNKMSLLKNKKFDVVIVDEAGQITQPAILGPLFYADSFVLVGDHLQMAPLVQSEAAAAAGYDVSLMRRLAEKFDGRDPVVKLTLQYRMHSDICYLVNEVCYNGLLKCGTDDVRDGVVSYKEGWDRSERGSMDRWLRQVMAPQNVVTFLDTDGLGADLETKAGGEVYNKTETGLISKIVKALGERGGIDLGDVGVISPYRAQVSRYLKADPYLSTCVETRGLEINTIDTYQGRDKKIIMISFVKSNSNGDVGNLLKDVRRLNVALSRAKMKLIMVGSLKCLRKGDETLDRVLGKVVDRNWVVKLGEQEGGKENRFSQGSDVFRFASSKTPVKFDVCLAKEWDEKNKKATNKKARKNND
ncbi:hypothetical protein TrST_g3744 [Triparma strigata]|uniref:DNA replication ATP-dependent helicase/nuclease n=1 Tax=Triparma strigata TaxID=1606541 RepID=A0A9W7EPA0_9STRA|nr:hypothetical protein TrST_g3744 [Triparma strigata]